jgi:UDP-N-acetylglucosamine acyltransferase
MMGAIHPSCVIEPGAKLGEGVVVGPFCHVGGEVVIGPDCHLKSHVSVTGRTTLGQGNKIWPHASLGGEPQDLKYTGENSELVIGDHNEIRENVTIHKGTANDAGITRIGNHNLIMVSAHIGHDCIIGDHVILSNCVQLAGHIHIEDYASLGGAAAVHHFVTVGRYAYIGGMTRVVSDAPPYMLTEGNPARVRKINSILLKRHHFDPDQVERLKIAHRMLFGHQEKGQSVGRSIEHLQGLDARWPDDEAIAALVASLRRSAAGVHGRFRESHRKDNPFSNPVQ